MGGGHTDGHVFQRAAEARHGVALKMGQHQHGVVIFQVLAYKVLLDALAAGDRQGHLPMLIHQVTGSNGCKAMFLHRFPVGGAGVAASLIGGVALHNGPLQLLNQGRNQGGLEEVVAAGLAGGNLDRHLALERDAQGMINPLQRLSGDFLCKINLNLFHMRSPLA